MRHHGGVAEACIHGFAPGTCLICQSLDLAKPTAPARNWPRSGPRVVPKEAPRSSSPAILKLAALSVAVVAVIIVAWTVLHIVFAVLHILELVGVALVAGYLGWVAGVYHGHRTARRD
jgi:hypothetical protein